jgi:hypothetical protein
VLYNSIFRADDRLFVNTHIYGLPAAQAPVWHLRKIPGGELARHYLDSFERVWDIATPHSQRSWKSTSRPSSAGLWATSSPFPRNRHRLAVRLGRDETGVQDGCPTPDGSGRRSSLRSFASLTWLVANWASSASSATSAFVTAQMIPTVRSSRIAAEEIWPALTTSHSPGAACCQGLNLPSAAMCENWSEWLREAPAPLGLNPVAVPRRAPTTS